MDLSRTDVVLYSSVSDIVAGLQFRTRGGKNLTGIKVSDAFNDQDGLSRQSRLRYDTPSFYGFSLAGSVVSNQRADAALFWGGQGYGFKAAAAAAVSDPNQNNTDLRYNGSFSMLHEHTGLNLTLSSGPAGPRRPRRPPQPLRQARLDRGSLGPGHHRFRGRLYPLLQTPRPKTTKAIPSARRWYS